MKTKQKSCIPFQNSYIFSILKDKTYLWQVPYKHRHNLKTSKAGNSFILLLQAKPILAKEFCLATATFVLLWFSWVCYYWIECFWWRWRKSLFFHVCWGQHHSILVNQAPLPAWIGRYLILSLLFCIKVIRLIRHRLSKAEQKIGKQKSQGCFSWRTWHNND